VLRIQLRPEMLERWIKKKEFFTRKLKGVTNELITRGVVISVSTGAGGPAVGNSYLGGTGLDWRGRRIQTRAEILLGN
jgi:hypothetical protein